MEGDRFESKVISVSGLEFPMTSENVLISCPDALFKIVIMAMDKERTYAVDLFIDSQLVYKSKKFKKRGTIFSIPDDRGDFREMKFQSTRHCTSFTEETQEGRQIGRIKLVYYATKQIKVRSKPRNEKKVNNRYSHLELKEIKTVESKVEARTLQVSVGEIVKPIPRNQEQQKRSDQINPVSGMRTIEVVERDKILLVQEIKYTTLKGGILCKMIHLDKIDHIKLFGSVHLKNNPFLIKEFLKCLSYSEIESKELFERFCNTCRIRDFRELECGLFEDFINKYCLKDKGFEIQYKKGFDTLRYLPIRNLNPFILANELESLGVFEQISLNYQSEINTMKPPIYRSYSRRPRESSNSIYIKDSRSPLAKIIDTDKFNPRQSDGRIKSKSPRVGPRPHDQRKRISRKYPRGIEEIDKLSEPIAGQILIEEPAPKNSSLALCKSPLSKRVKSQSTFKDTERPNIVVHSREDPQNQADLLTAILNPKYTLPSSSDTSPRPTKRIKIELID